MRGQPTSDVERAQHRSAVVQRDHIGLALRVFLRLECHRLRTGVSWFEAKTAIVPMAVRAYRGVLTTSWASPVAFQVMAQRA